MGSARRSVTSGGDRDPFPLEDLAGQREVFVESVEAMRRSTVDRMIPVKRQRQRIIIPGSRSIPGTGTGLARRPHYELVDWRPQGLDEVTVEFQCESRRCDGLAIEISDQAVTIAGAMPGRTAPRPLDERPGWLCLAFAYPGTSRPDDVAGGMHVLIDRSRPIADP